MYVLILALSYPVKKYFLLSGFSTVAIPLLIAMGLLSHGYGASAKRPRKLHVLYSLIPILLLFIYSSIIGIFGSFDFASIVFHLEMGINGGAPDGVFKTIFRYSLSFLFFVGSFWLLINLDRRFLVLDRAIFIPLLLVNPLTWSAAEYALINRYDDRLLHAYHSPENLKLTGADRKNLIIIYAESTERTFSEISYGERSFLELSQIAASGLEVQGIRQVNNTGWSIAGFVASQCGMPLQPRGLLSHNMFEGQETFFSGVVCMSDVLNENGYHTEFMNGADHSFAGMATFLKTHGFDYASGLSNFVGIVGSYRNSWGLYDDTVFAQAEQRIRNLNTSSEPFAFSVGTIAGHFPDGHPTKACLQKFGKSDLPPILLAVKCTGYEIDNFLTNLRQDGLLKNTIVVIVSDHLMMKNQFTDELDTKERMNYFVVLEDGLRPKVVKREAAMFDVFPTVLDLLGFPLENGRAGVGVSLLSEHKTLVEQFGIEVVNTFIRNDRLLARKAWIAE